MLRDLLGDDPTAKLDIKQGREGLFVPGLTEIQVNDVDELNEVGIQVNFPYLLIFYVPTGVNLSGFPRADKI